jgi:two-component system sensor histidine kinase BaeS
LTLEECDLALVGTEALELVAPLAREKNTVLRSSIEPVRIKADSARIGQVLVNLLYNAIQHNPKGTEVRLSAQTQGTEVILCVSDNGAGIPAESLPHIFERFYRADKSRGGAKNGSGLGLAISHAIVQAHGGTIRAESQAGHGTIFTVRLPLAG